MHCDTEVKVAFCWLLSIRSQTWICNVLNQYCIFVLKQDAKYLIYTMWYPVHFWPTDVDVFHYIIWNSNWFYLLYAKRIRGYYLMCTCSGRLPYNSVQTTNVFTFCGFGIYIFNFCRRLLQYEKRDDRASIVQSSFSLFFFISHLNISLSLYLQNCIIFALLYIPLI